jgi:RNA polymerase sigma factor (sigma-70 family)
MAQVQEAPLDAAREGPPACLAAGVVRRVWWRLGDAFPSDVREDCELEARLTLWQLREKLAALPEGERDAYATTCVRHRLEEVLQRERRQRAPSVSLDALRSDEGYSIDVADRRDAGWEDLISSSLLDQIGRTDLVAAVSALPARDQDILDLYYAGEMTDGEIAGLVHSSPAAVKVQRNRAIGKLRQRLGEEWEETNS